MLLNSLTVAQIIALLVCVDHVCIAEEPTIAKAVATVVERPASAPAENPPQVNAAAAIDENGSLVLVKIETIFVGFDGYSDNRRSLVKVPLTGVQISTVAGKPLSVDEARARLDGKDTPIICSSWNRSLPAFYASIFTPDTLHFTFPKTAPAWNSIQEPGRPLRGSKSKR